MTDNAWQRFVDARRKRVRDYLEAGYHLNKHTGQPKSKATVAEELELVAPTLLQDLRHLRRFPLIHYWCECYRWRNGPPPLDERPQPPRWQHSPQPTKAARCRWRLFRPTTRQQPR